MNVLFYSTYHFNTETFGPSLELIQTHLNNGDNVYFLGCDDELPSCQTNPHHSKLICKTCISTRKNALQSLNGSIKYLSIQKMLSPNDFNSQLDLIDTTSISNFKNTQFEAFDIGMAVMSSLVSIYRDPTPDLTKHQQIIEKQWIASMWVYEAVKSCIKTFAIDRSYVFNARFATLRACLRASEWLKCACFVLEESNDRAHYAIYENAMPHSITYVETKIQEIWDNSNEDKEKIGISYFKNRSEGKDGRFGHFTSHQNKKLLPENWNPDKENIVIYISSEDEFVSIGKEWENHLYKNQVDGITQICTSFLAKPEFVFYVRVHPNLSGILNQSIKDLYAIRLKNLNIIPAESPISTYNLMFNANKVVSFGSSVGIEAAAIGKISILAGKAFYMNLGSTYNPSKHEELVTLIANMHLIPKPTEGALKYAYFLLNFGLEYKFFKRKDQFQATINGRLYGPDKLHLLIRKVGRVLRIRKEKRLKQKNKLKVQLLAKKQNQYK